MNKQFIHQHLNIIKASAKAMEATATAVQKTGLSVLNPENRSRKTENTG